MYLHESIEIHEHRIHVSLPFQWVSNSEVQLERHSALIVDKDIKAHRPKAYNIGTKCSMG
jgi:hypothetical protein